MIDRSPSQWPRLLAVLLIGANLFLLAIITAKFSKGSTAKIIPAPLTVTAEVVRVITRKSAGSDPTVLSTAPRFSWRTIESSDYKQYISNLRAVRCPEETIQDIIVAEVNKQFAGREAALKLRPEQNQPWEAGSSGDYRMVQKFQKMRELLAEKRELIRELLGVDIPLEYPDLSPFRQDQKFEAALKFLPEAKRDQVRTIQNLFQERSEKLQERTMGEFEQEDQKEFVKIRAERREALAKVLSPQEFEDLELRTSSTASSLRSQLSGFEPSEKEFRDIFRMRNLMEEQYASPLEPGDRVAQQKRAEQYRQMQEDLKSVLGEPRFAEYQRSQDWNYRNLTQVARQNNLPKEAALKGYEIQQTAQQHLQKIQMNRELTSEERKTATAAIRAETEKALLETLGEKGMNSFKNYGGLQNLGFGP